MTTYTSQGTISVRIGRKRAVLFFVPTPDYSHKHKDQNLALFSRGLGKIVAKKYDQERGVGVKVKIGKNKSKKELIRAAKKAAKSGTRVEVKVRHVNVGENPELKLTSIRFFVK